MLKNKVNWWQHLYIIIIIIMLNLNRYSKPADQKVMETNYNKIVK